MLHTATAHWTPAHQTSVAFQSTGTQLAMATQTVAANDTGAVSLSESLSTEPQLVAMTTTPFAAQGSANESSLYSAETAVLALGMVGAWMMVVGGAMLSRRVRLVRE